MQMGERPRLGKIRSYAEQLILASSPLFTSPFLRLPPYESFPWFGSGYAGLGILRIQDLGYMSGQEEHVRTSRIISMPIQMLPWVFFIGLDAIFHQHALSIILTSRCQSGTFQPSLKPIVRFKNFPKIHIGFFHFRGIMECIRSRHSELLHIITTRLIGHFPSSLR